MFLQFCPTLTAEPLGNQNPKLKDVKIETNTAQWNKKKSPREVN